MNTPAIRTYAEAAAALSNRQARKVGNNTTLERNAGNIELKLHGSAIVIYQPDGAIVLDTCGWPTRTTIDRLNTFGPRGWVVSSDKKKLVIWERASGYQASKMPFLDGCTFTPSPVDGCYQAAGVGDPGEGVSTMRSGWKGY